MLPDPGTIVTIVGLAVAGLSWLIRLEGRQNTHEQVCEEREKRREGQLIDFKAQLGDVKATLLRVDEKLDRVIEER